MIDTTFDFRLDTPAGNDPDKYSQTLKTYHQLLWSKTLPNGEVMKLEQGKGLYYLTWKDFDFGSDSIIVELRYKKYQHIIDKVAEIVGDLDLYYEKLLCRSYTIGGMIIFPKHVNSMNQRRGIDDKISDRWDLTLECIRRHYAREESPLTSIIESDNDFYDLFVDFKQETYDEYGTYIWRRWVPITCTTLEYIVSFVENPSPLSFYRDFVREGKWEKETVWVDAFEFHYCLFGKDLSEIDLYVPEESIELYRITADWNKFRNILPMTDEMKNSYERAWNEAMTVKTPEGKDACVERWYSINGHRLSSPRKGINIGVMSDGSTRKVIGK